MDVTGIVAFLFEKGLIALALCVYAISTIWKRYTASQEASHKREIETSKESAAMAKEVTELAKEFLPVLKAVESRGGRVDDRIRQLEEGQKKILDAVSKIT